MGYASRQSSARDHRRPDGEIRKEIRRAHSRGSAAGWVERELLGRYRFQTREEAGSVLFSYLEAFYNRRRRH